MDGRIDAEMARAQEAEEVLSLRLDAEVTRAETAEQENADAIAVEASRASAAEKVLTDNLAAELSRATGAEQQVADDLQAFAEDVITKEEIDALDGIEPEPPENQYRPMTVEEIDNIINQ